MLTVQEKTKVIILTANYRIRGDIALLPDARVTDFIVNARDFIAVTDAEVSDSSGRPLLTSSFLNIQKQWIEAIMPSDLATMV